MKTLRWGVLGTAKIAREWMIPAIRESRHAELVAVASRDLNRAKTFAKSIAEGTLAFGSYEDMLACDDIDAVYIPLPNHLHVPWSIKAIEAGKHVLCEKPLGLNSDEVRQLQETASNSPALLVMEAFMYRFHPQWRRVRELIESGEFGEIKHVQTSFTYNNTNPEDVRNMSDIGGGGLMDIGCYCISAARFIFGKEPLKVVGDLEWDPEFNTDRHASGILDFGQGMATFQCSTQSNLSQMVKLIGEKATLLVENPFFRRGDMPSRLILHRGDVEETITVGSYNHYVCQVDAFCRAALSRQPAPTPLVDALANMRVIDAIFTSAREEAWAPVQQ